MLEKSHTTLPVALLTDRIANSDSAGQVDMNLDYACIYFSLQVDNNLKLLPTTR